jgi:MarR family
MDDREENGGRWTLLTGHGHVLVEIARNPTARIRDIAAAAGITERTAQSIVADLEAAGYLTRERAGRRTSYTLNRSQPFRHQSQDGHLVGPFLALLVAEAADGPAAPMGNAQDQQHGTAQDSKDRVEDLGQ